MSINLTALDTRRCNKQHGQDHTNTCYHFYPHFEARIIFLTDAYD